MATNFIQFSSDHHHLNLTSTHENQTRPVETMKHSSTGRRRYKGPKKPATQKNKTPQRGMGVAQLENLRKMQESSFKYSSLNPTASTHHSFSTISSFASASASVATGDTIVNSCPVVQFPKLCGQGVNNPMRLISSDFSVHQKVAKGGYGSTSTVTYGDDQLICGHDNQFQTHQMALYGFATSSKATTHIEKSKQLFSSVPNLLSEKSCFSDRCRTCSKKKRIINGVDMGCNRETSLHTKNMIRENQDFGTKPLLHPYCSLDKDYIDSKKGVNIVAVHRKGSSLYSSEEGGLVMEYEFFPEKSGKSTSYFEKEEMMMKMMMSTNSSESSSVAAAVGGSGGEASCVTTISWVDTTPTSSIDLSLKLSC